MTNARQDQRRAILWMLDGVLLVHPGKPGEAEAVSQHVVPARGAPEALREIELDILLAGVSRAATGVARDVLESLGWLRRFSHVQGSDEGAVDGWSSARNFEAVLDVLGVEPARALAVVRSEDEARAAADAGMRVAAIPDGWTPVAPPSAHFVLSGVSAVPALLRSTR